MTANTAGVKVDTGELTPEKLRALITLRGKGSGGPWMIKKAVFTGAPIGITTYARDKPDNMEGNVAAVHVINTVYFNRPIGPGGSLDKSISKTYPIKQAPHDAELIVEAVNHISTLAKALLDNAEVSDTMWVIVYPADIHGPERYYSALYDLPVVDLKLATRFSRKVDVEAIKQRYDIRGGYISEYRIPGQDDEE